MRRTCLSLLSLLCFCSVARRTVYTSARSCLSARTTHDLVAWLKIPRLCRPHKKKTITISRMLARERSTSLTLTSSSSIPSSRTTSQVTLPIDKHCATPPKEESGPLTQITSSTGYEPNILDDFHYSETTEIFFQEQSSDTNALVLAWRGAQWPSAKLSLHHCSFRSEKNQRAVDKLITLLKKVCCHSPCLSVM